MAIAWFLCPMKQAYDERMKRYYRYCAMDDFTKQIRADGGDWAESEVLGNMAVVKVRASDTTLTKIAATEGFTKLPKSLLSATLSDLTSAQKTAVRDKIEALGYTTTEIKNALGNDIASKTLGDVLKFIASRRLRPRLDKATNTIVCDGDPLPCAPIDTIDKAVT